MEITLRKPEYIFRNGISPSMIKTWLTCRRSWYNRYVRGLSRPGGIEADFGKVFHKFLSNYYLNTALTVEKAIEDFKLAWPEEKDTEKRSQDLGIRLIREYFKRYPRETEPFKILWWSEENEKSETSEKSGDFQVLLPSGLRANVRLDAYVEKQGGVYVLDNKTASQLGATYFEQYQNDYQIAAYVYALQKKLGKQVEGVIINGVGCKKVVNADSFLRADIVKTQSQIDYMMKNFDFLAQEIVEYVTKNYEDVEMFPMSAHSTACKSFNTKCPFLDICQFNDNTNLGSHLLKENQ